MKKIFFVLIFLFGPLPVFGEINFEELETFDQLTHEGYQFDFVQICPSLIGPVKLTHFSHPKKGGRITIILFRHYARTPFIVFTDITGDYRYYITNPKGGFQKDYTGKFLTVPVSCNPLHPKLLPKHLNDLM